MMNRAVGRTDRVPRRPINMLTLPSDIAYKEYVELIENIKKDVEFPDTHRDAIIMSIQSQWAKIKLNRMMQKYAGDKRPRND